MTQKNSRFKKTPPLEYPEQLLEDFPCDSIEDFKQSIVQKELEKIIQMQKQSDSFL